MKELSLFLLDIAENSVSAGASRIELELSEEGGEILFRVSDNGCGMTPEFLARVTDPFTTSRTTRKVGMGIPLLKMTAEMSGGSFSIRSTPGEGTETAARFSASSLDTPPMGDLPSTLVTLIQGAPDRDFVLLRRRNGTEYTLNTGELREIMGEVPLDEPEVLDWILSWLREQESGLTEETESNSQ